VVVYLEVVGRALRLVQDLSEPGVEAVGFVKPVGVEPRRAASCWRAAAMDVPEPPAGPEPEPVLVVVGNGLTAALEDAPV